MTKQMQQNLIAIVMFLVMISFAYANYLIKPLNKKTMDTTNKLESIEDRLETMRRRARELPKLEKEMKVLQEEVASLEKLLPREKNIEEILNVISKTAQKYDVVINNITPGKLVPKNNYNEIPFKITAECNYHSIAQFLTEMGHLSRIMSARDLSLRYKAPSGGKSRAVTMMADFSLIAYTFKDK